MFVQISKQNFESAIAIRLEDLFELFFIDLFIQHEFVIQGLLGFALFELLYQHLLRLILYFDLQFVVRILVVLQQFEVLFVLDCVFEEVQSILILNVLQFIDLRVQVLTQLEKKHQAHLRESVKDYIKQTFLKDGKQLLLSPPDLAEHVEVENRDVALEEHLLVNLNGLIQ